MASTVFDRLFREASDRDFANMLTTRMLIQSFRQMDAILGLGLGGHIRYNIPPIYRVAKTVNEAFNVFENTCYEVAQRYDKPFMRERFVVVTTRDNPFDNQAKWGVL